MITSLGRFLIVGKKNGTVGVAWIRSVQMHLGCMSVLDPHGGKIDRECYIRIDDISLTSVSGYIRLDEG